MAWLDTYEDLGSEIEASRQAAVAEFLAAPCDSAIGAPAAVPPQISRNTWIETHELSSGDKVKLLLVVWGRGIGRAFLKHIGPYSDDGSITFSIHNTGDSPPVQQLNMRARTGVRLSSEVPLPDGVGDPGIYWGDEAAAKRHVHPLISDLKSNLFTALKDSGLHKGPVKCCYTGFAACGNWLFDAAWTQVTAGTWVKNLPGPLNSSMFDGVALGLEEPTVPPSQYTGSPMIGQTVLAYHPSLEPGEPPHQVPMVIVDLGFHWENWGTEETPQWHGVTTYATLQRHPDFNASENYTQNMSFEVQEGTSYGGKFAKLTTATPIDLGTDDLAWSMESSNPNSPDYPLLTASQLVDASSAEYTRTVTLKASDGQVSIGEIGGFETYVGTPGIDTIPAGQFTAQIKAKVSDTTDQTTITVKLLKDTGSGFTQLLAEDFPPIPGVQDYALQQLAQAMSEQDVAGCRLLVHYYAQTDSATDVTVTVVHNDPDRSCRIGLPVEFPVGSNEDHRTTTHRDAKDQHPPSACGVYWRHLADDWAPSTVDTWETAEGMSVPVEAGRTYRVEIEVVAYWPDLIYTSPARTYRIAVGGSATASAVRLTHRVESESDEAAEVPAELLATITRGSLGDAYYVEAPHQSETSASEFVRWTITGAVEVSADGTLDLRVYQSQIPGPYTGDRLLALSTMKVEVME